MSVQDYKTCGASSENFYKMSCAIWVNTRVKTVIGIEFLRKLINFTDNNTSVSSHALVINLQLQILNMSLKSITCEHTGQEYWMLVSNIVDDSTK